MGSYDVTCAISNLAIRRGDKVRWALLAPQRVSHPNMPLTYACDNYSFFTPLLPGIYNDYGGMEWDGLSTLWHWLWHRIASHIKPDERYPRQPNWDNPQEVFTELSYGVHDYVSDEWITNQGNLRLKLQIWMVHEAIFNHVKEMEALPDSSVSEVNDYVFPDHRLDMFLTREQGAMHIETRPLFVKDPDFAFVKDDYRTAVSDTFQFVRNLFYIRKVLQPMSTYGMQYEDNRKIEPWIKFLGQMEARQRKQWNE